MHIFLMVDPGWKIDTKIVFRQYVVWGKLKVILT